MHESGSVRLEADISELRAQIRTLRSELAALRCEAGYTYIPWKACHRVLDVCLFAMLILMLIMLEHGVK